MVRLREEKVLREDQELCLDMLDLRYLLDNQVEILPKSNWMGTSRDKIMRVINVWTVFKALRVNMIIEGVSVNRKEAVEGAPGKHNYKRKMRRTSGRRKTKESK